jgi:hypothetical protein
MTDTPRSDFIVRGYGDSVVLLSPLTEEARDWVSEYLADPMWFGNAVAIEHRYIDPIVEGIIRDGLGVLNGPDEGAGS